MMKTFNTQPKAIEFINNPINEIKAIMSMVTNHQGQYDIVYIVSESKYDQYLEAWREGGAL